MTDHRSYLHTENRENSLRCTCGNWTGENCVDVAGFERHVLVTRPAYRAMSLVLAAWTGTAQKIAFTGYVDGRLERLDLDGEHDAEHELLASLLTAIEPHLRAEHYEQAADRLTEAGPQNGEKPWPFAMLLRQDADDIRTGLDQAREETMRARMAEVRTLLEGTDGN
jgi:hypothetical protein